MTHKANSKAWISTYRGKQFFLLHPRVKDIDIRDIAHSLAQQCRWTGHTIYHYSVAQHSYYCSFIGPEEEAFDRLMHDGSEAYMGDMNRPLKHYTKAGPAYRLQEAVVQNAIRVRFGLSLTEPESVHIADEAMLWAEKKQVMRTNHKWHHTGTAADIKIVPWSPVKAEKMFLKRFYQLQKGRA